MGKLLFGGGGKHRDPWGGGGELLLCPPPSLDETLLVAKSCVLDSQVPVHSSSTTVHSDMKGSYLHGINWPGANPCML